MLLLRLLLPLLCCVVVAQLELYSSSADPAADPGILVEATEVKVECRGFDER